MGILNIDPRHDHRLRVRLMLQLTGLSYDILELDELRNFRAPDDWNVFRTIIIGDTCYDSLLKSIVYLRGRLASGPIVAISPITSEDCPAVRRLIDAGANIVLDPDYGMSKSALAIKRFMNWASPDELSVEAGRQQAYPAARHWAEKVFY